MTLFMPWAAVRHLEQTNHPFESWNQRSMICQGEPRPKKVPQKYAHFLGRRGESDIADLAKALEGDLSGSEGATFTGECKRRGRVQTLPSPSHPHPVVTLRPASLPHNHFRLEVKASTGFSCSHVPNPKRARHGSPSFCRIRYHLHEASAQPHMWIVVLPHAQSRLSIPLCSNVRSEVIEGASLVIRRVDLVAVLR